MKYLSEPSTSPPPQWRHPTHQVLSEQSMYCTAECYISTAFLLTCLQKAVRTLQFSPMHINASNQASTALQFWQLSEQLCSIALPGFPFFFFFPCIPYLLIYVFSTAEQQCVHSLPALPPVPPGCTALRTQPQGSHVLTSIDATLQSYRRKNRVGQQLLRKAPLQSHPSCEARTAQRKEQVGRIWVLS